MGRFEVAIFDLDGVIILSEKLYADVASELLISLGIQPENVDRDRFVGGSAERMWSTLFEEHGVDEDVHRILAVEKEMQFKAVQKNLTEIVNPGIFEMINELLELGFELGLATSSWRRSVDQILERLGIGEKFSATVCGDEVTKGKPSPEIYNTILRKLGQSTSRCLVFEDSENGLQSATAAGLTCVRVALGAQSDKEALRIPDFRSSARRDVIEYLKSEFII
ncbi:HAD family hydrolase [Hwanghaeella sp. LZ110]|uniref:HAD family hydrolase n=1 Tax=Hwanghaeella sp. LZ110 TaxID=3402810 RepID=UPI003B66F648